MLHKIPAHIAEPITPEAVAIENATDPRRKIPNVDNKNIP